MRIYSHKIYRKIYQDHYGPIPKEADGRSYEIHHIDGDHNNNNPSNLKAVTLQEHYDIHYAQGDYNSCLLMSFRINLNPEELSALRSKAAYERVANGTHPWSDKEKAKIRNQKRTAQGKNVFSGGDNVKNSLQKKLTLILSKLLAYLANVLQTKHILINGTVITASLSVKYNTYTVK
jgi:hypothetical protein